MMHEGVNHVSPVSVISSLGDEGRNIPRQSVKSFLYKQRKRIKGGMTIENLVAEATFKLSQELEYIPQAAVALDSRRSTARASSERLHQKLPFSDQLQAAFPSGMPSLNAPFPAQTSFRQPDAALPMHESGILESSYVGGWPHVSQGLRPLSSSPALLPTHMGGDQEELRHQAASALRTLAAENAALRQQYLMKIGAPSPLSSLPSSTGGVGLQAMQAPPRPIPQPLSPQQVQPVQYPSLSYFHRMSFAPPAPPGSVPKPPGL